jgi:hypothetical protein
MLERNNTPGEALDLLYFGGREDDSIPMKRPGRDLLFRPPAPERRPGDRQLFKYFSYIEISLSVDN